MVPLNKDAKQGNAHSELSESEDTKEHVEALEKLVVGMLECETTTDHIIERPLTKILDVVSQHPEVDILLAPEWFFVSEGKMFYNPHEYAFIRKKLEEVTKESGMLLIPGSIARLDDEGHYQNTALVISGGETLLEYSKRADGGDTSFAKKQGVEWRSGRERGFFNWRTYEVGVEICADHGSLKTKDEQSGLDIQILVSCGVSLYSEDFAVHDNGLVLLCDGSAPKQGIQYAKDAVPVSLLDARYDTIPVSEDIKVRLFTLKRPGPREGVLQKIKRKIGFS